MRKTMTDRGVAALKPRTARYAVPDPQMIGHWVRIQPSNTKSFWAVTRDPDGKQKWTLIGPADIGIEASRAKARTILARVREGLPAFEPKGETFAVVATNWLRRHVEANKLRSQAEIKRLLDVHVLPVLGDREFVTVRRSSINTLLDEIEDGHGARQSDYCLALISGIANWYASRVDDYNTPIVPGMRRYKMEEHKRERTLTDDELRVVWKLAEANGTYGALIRLLLLTAQRRAKVVSMRWEDISEDGVWTIQQAPREKANAMKLVLPQAALDIIRAQPQFAGNPFILAGRGGHIKNYSRLKKAFDAKLTTELPDMKPWVLHDLRRTARSLMSRAKVLSEHAERTLGHVIGGVEGIYDRHPFTDEKSGALKQLAALIDAIVHGRGADVVPLRAQGRQ